MNIVDETTGEIKWVHVNPHVESCIAAGVDPEKMNEFIRSQFNYKPKPNPERSHLDPSVTVPDQEYTIADLIKRHEQGLLTDLNISRPGVYTQTDEDNNFDVPDIEKIRDADINDQNEYMREINKEVGNYNKAVEEVEKERAKAAKEAKAAKKAASATTVVPNTSEGGKLGTTK